MLHLYKRNEFAQSQRPEESRGGGGGPGTVPWRVSHRNAHPSSLPHSRWRRPGAHLPLMRESLRPPTIFAAADRYSGCAQQLSCGARRGAAGRQEGRQAVQRINGGRTPG